MILKESTNTLSMHLIHRSDGAASSESCRQKNLRCRKMRVILQQILSSSPQTKPSGTSLTANGAKGINNLIASVLKTLQTTNRPVYIGRSLKTLNVTIGSSALQD